MKMLKVLLAVFLCLLTHAAAAHPGHGIGGFIPGLAHPFLGLDHVAAAVAVGLWAGACAGALRYAVPALFVAAMACGAMLAESGLRLPFVEPGVAVSVLLLGVMLLFRGRGWRAGAALIGLFALYHGEAHVPGDLAATPAYLLGLASATAILHMVGVAVAPYLRRTYLAAAPLMLAGGFLLARALG